MALLVVSGCDSDRPDPNYSSVAPTPSTTTSPTPTPAASPTGIPSTGPNVNPGEVAPTEPSAAKMSDSAGAIAFVAYYVKMTDWLFATSDTAVLDQFFGPSCTTCLSAQQYLKGLVPDGRHFRGGRISIQALQVVKNDGRQSADFAITSVTDVDAAEVVSNDGAVVQNFPATKGFQLTDWVRFVDGSWQIVEERKV